MKGIPIKFRGKRVKDDKTVHGWAYKSECPMSSFSAIIDYNDKYNVVYPDSVAQLLGYDVDGKKVYEGDGVKDENELKYFAILEPRMRWQNGTCTDWSFPFENVVKE